MNTKLEKLFKKYNVSKKDRIEIEQIFGLLPLSKKQSLLDNFGLLVRNIELKRKEFDLERRILVGDILGDVRGLYNRYN